MEHNSVEYLSACTTAKMLSEKMKKNTRTEIELLSAGPDGASFDRNNQEHDLSCFATL